MPANETSPLGSECNAELGPLLQALGEVAYEDLIGDLERYGCFTNAAAIRALYPQVSRALVLAAMDVADECPVCLRRFVSLRGRHDTDCALRPLLGA